MKARQIGNFNTGTNGFLLAAMLLIPVTWPVIIVGMLSKKKD